MCVLMKEVGYGYTRHLVNGVGVTSFDFGTVNTIYDKDSQRTLRMFVPKPASEEVMEKYHVTEEEYQEVCEELTMRFTDWNRMKEGNEYEYLKS